MKLAIFLTALFIGASMVINMTPAPDNMTRGPEDLLKSAVAALLITMCLFSLTGITRKRKPCENCSETTTNRMFCNQCLRHSAQECAKRLKELEK